MKKFRKITALLAVTALVLTGCSGGKKETEKATEKATTTERLQLLRQKKLLQPQ